MKKTNLFFVLLIFISVSCDKTNVENPVTQVLVSADKIGLFADGVDKITFIANLPDNSNVSSESEFYVNNEKITGNQFITQNKGDYKVYAVYKEVKSAEFSFKAIEKVISPATYSSKILVEDFTGTWCGWCPRLAYKLDQAANANAKIIPVGVHYGDGMTYTFVNQMASKYAITGYPTGLINRSSKWNESQAHLDNFLAKKASLGLAISSTITGSRLDVNVKVGFAETISAPLKLVVYITEDGIVEDQRNYLNTDINSPWYQAGDPLVGFVHNHVLRSALTDIFGNDIPNYLTLGRNTYSTDLSIDISDYFPGRLHLVAFVVNGTTSSDIYNVQTVKAGSSIAFD